MNINNKRERADCQAFVVAHVNRVELSTAQETYYVSRRVEMMDDTADDDHDDDDSRGSPHTRNTVVGVESRASGKQSGPRIALRLWRGNCP